MLPQSTHFQYVILLILLPPLRYVFQPDFAKNPSDYRQVEQVSKSTFLLSCISNKASFFIATPVIYHTSVRVDIPQTQYFSFVRNSQRSFHFLMVAHVYSEQVFTYSCFVYTSFYADHTGSQEGIHPSCIAPFWVLVPSEPAWFCGILASRTSYSRFLALASTSFLFSQSAFDGTL